MQRSKNKIKNKSLEREEKEINEPEREESTEKEEWEKPIIYEGDVALYCMSEG